jgi:hypothetical protein
MFVNIFYSNDRKKHICTRCLSLFNYKRTIQDHLPRCPNEVRIGNLIDQLQVTGGFWKEQRRRRLDCFVRHSEKLKKELEQMDLEDTDQSKKADEHD